MTEKIPQASTLQKGLLPEQGVAGKLPSSQEESDEMRAEYEFDQNSIKNPYIKDHL